jgi:hypothetical protein
VHITQEEHGINIPLALVSLFSRPDESLLALSVNTLWSCVYQGDGALRFIDVKNIQAVVAMVPHRPEIQGLPPSERFFLVEKPGLDVAIVTDVGQDGQGDEEEDT